MVCMVRTQFRSENVSLVWASWKHMKENVSTTSLSVRRFYLYVYWDYRLCPRCVREVQVQLHMYHQ